MKLLMLMVTRSNAFKTTNDFTEIHGDVEIYELAVVKNDVNIFGNSKIHGHARVVEKCRVKYDSELKDIDGIFIDRNCINTLNDSRRD